ncbi:MAG: hypothetical protein U0Q18_08630 [Bryobacteraceae bacterium]
MSRAVGEARTVSAPSAGRVLSGFLVSGFLFALLGAVLPAWGYHRDPPEFVTIGNYFLALAAGVTASARLAPWIQARKSLQFQLVLACALGCAALLSLASVPPPAHWLWRVAGLALTGLAVGLLNAGLFHAIPVHEIQNTAQSGILGGIYYGLGCLAVTLLVAGTFYVYTVPSILILMAVLPGIFAGLYAQAPLSPGPPPELPSLRQTWRDFRSVGAVLFALLLFFQFGNEWSIAGWLPLFLIRRLGISPPASLWILAWYWFALLVGRLGAVLLLPRIRHSRMLIGSVVSAIFGCFLLTFTDNQFGAVMSVLFLGAGFASIYPLVAEKIRGRFPYYHPVFFSGIFSFALFGGLAAPATLGYAAQAWGIGVVMALPLLGTCMVFALLLLIWLESKVTGR